MCTGSYVYATGCGVFRPSPVTSSTTRSSGPTSPAGDRRAERAERDAGRRLAEDAGRRARAAPCSRRSRPRRTAWIAPPVSRAVATAKSPSAGLPIASDRATVSGRTGVTGFCSWNAVATGLAALGLPSDQPRRRRRRRARAQRSSANPWPTLWNSAPEAIGMATTSGVAPAELLGDLVGERLRALGVVRAQVDVDEPPRKLERELHGKTRAVVVVAVDGVDRRPVDGSGRELLRLEVGRDEDGRVEPFGGRAGRDRAGEVAGRRARERRQPELLRLARRDGDHPVLERVRRVRGVELEPQLADAELLRQPRGAARAASSRARAAARRAARRAEGRRTARATAGRPRCRSRVTVAAQRVPVVDRVERPEAPRAGTDRLERVLGRADATGKGEG